MVSSSQNKTQQLQLQ